MSIEDRDWRKEEVRQQRRQQNQRGNQNNHTGLSVEQFLAANAKTRKPAQLKRSYKPTFFIVLFLIILISSGSFLLYQLFSNIS